MKETIDFLKKKLCCRNDRELGEMFGYGWNTIRRIRRGEKPKLTPALIIVASLLREISDKKISAWLKKSNFPLDGSTQVE